MRAHLCLLICGLFLSAGVQAQESAWDPVQALKVGTRLIIEQRAGRTAHGRWESADDARLIVRARGRSLAIPRSAIAEVDQVIPRRYFDRKRARRFCDWGRVR